MPKPCERCGGDRDDPRCRFCPRCRVYVIAELRASGYLTRLPSCHRTHAGPADRPPEEPGPWDNAVRAYEEANADG